MLFIIAGHVVDVDDWATISKLGTLMGVIVLGYVLFVFVFYASAQTLNYLVDFRKFTICGHSSFWDKCQLEGSSAYQMSK